MAQLFEGTAAASDVDAALAVLEERSGRQIGHGEVEHEEAAQVYDRLGAPIGGDELGLGGAVGDTALLAGGRLGGIVRYQYTDYSPQ